MLKLDSLTRCTTGCFLGLLALFGAGSSIADDNFGEKSVRLSSFHPESGPVRMHGISEGVDIYLPLSSTAKISNASIDLQFIHSIVLLGERSSIRVLFNETTLEQIPYNPEQPMVKSKVSIPDELWRKGFNKLSISVIQHYIDRCEDSTSPELWTELDLYNSTLSYNIEPVKRELTLRDITGLFSPGIGGLNSIHLLSSPAADLSTPTSSYLNESLPLVAQSLALHRDYSPLEVKHTRWKGLDEGGETERSSAEGVSAYLPDTVSSNVHVLIGTRDELTGILADDLLEQINGPYLHLDRVVTETGDKSGRGFRLVVAGRSGSEVNHAARALAYMDDSMSALRQLELLSGKAGIGRLAGDRGFFVQPETSYSIADLGVSTTTMQGAGSKKVSVELPVRGNFYTQETATFDLLLDFAYGAGMGKGSVLSIFLNGEYVHGLQLQQPGGGTFRDYRISMPARKLQPGVNTLEFNFSMRAETVAGECRSIPASHLIAQILDTSTIHFPAASPVAVQPDLSTFSATAFPYIDNTNKSPSEFVVASEQMLGEVLSLAGKLAQVSRSAAEHLYVRTTVPDKLVNNTVLLVTRDEMPVNILSKVSEKIERSERWSYRLLNKLRTAHAASPTDSTRPALDTSALNESIDSKGVLMALRTPHSGKPSTLTVITADSRNLLGQRVRDLMTPQVWGQLDGDLVAWERPEDTVITMRVGDYYVVGDQDPWSLFVLIVSNNPWYLLAVLLSSFLIIGLLTLRYLRKREARRLAE
ncbi:MAG: cellulose biosynthesis cyclic di-GMP-binding regulatory protein BcsB [Pseudomonadota bacterium]